VLWAGALTCPKLGLLDFGRVTRPKFLIDLSPQSEVLNSLLEDRTRMSFSWITFTLHDVFLSYTKMDIKRNS
jgi:hypothetical protein